MRVAGEVLEGAFIREDGEMHQLRPVVVTVRAPDGPGLVAEIATTIARAGGNIIDVGQHTDEETSGFGCRLEIDPAIDRGSLLEGLRSLRTSRGVDFQVHDEDPPARVVIAASSTLHCVSDLLARVSIGALDCEVVGIVSDRTEAAALAERHGVAFHHLAVGDDRQEQERALLAVLDDLDPALVVLARYMRVLPPEICERFSERMINIHHSFLPAFAGAGPYTRAHSRGVKLIGATAHYVTPELDEGPIIAQDVVRVSHRDSVDDLVRRGADVERTVLASAVRLHLEHRVFIFGNRTCVFD